MRKIVIGDCFKGDYQPILVVDNTHPYADECFLVSDTAERSMYLTTDELRRRESIPTLHLPIGNDAKKYGGAWFDLILSGEKTEEYRVLSAFYESRFGTKVLRTDDGKPYHTGIGKPYKVIHLTNGYSHERPQLWAHIEEITIGKGKPEWGAPETDVFIIKLGKVFHTKNLKAK